jgi:hypothetical protein
MRRRDLRLAEAIPADEISHVCIAVSDLGNGIVAHLRN